MSIITPKEIFFSKKNQEKSARVDKIGIHFENLNFPPVASRVLGYLLTAEPSHATFNEIMAFLGASKSSVSNALKYLINDNRVDYITFNKDRKRYFKVNPVLWRKAMMDKVDNWRLSIEFQEEILKERNQSGNNAFNDSLKQTLKFETFVQKKMKQAIIDWEKQYESK